MQFINHYSFLLIAAVSAAGYLVYALRRGLQKQDLLALGALLIGFSVAFMLFQPLESELAPGPFAESAQNQQAVLIQFESPFCLGCMAAKPLVSSVLLQTGDRMAFHPINVLDPAAQPYVEQYAVQFTPTFILLDEQQNELYRSIGTIDAEAIRTILQIPAEDPGQDEAHE